MSNISAETEDPYGVSVTVAQLAPTQLARVRLLHTMQDPSPDLGTNHCDIRQCKITVWPVGKVLRGCTARLGRGREGSSPSIRTGNALDS